MTNKTKTIKVPKGIKFLSDFKHPDDNTRFELPHGILDKGITGCGGTTLAIEDDNPTIICVPRKALMQCKSDAYPNLLTVDGSVDSRTIEKYIEEHNPPKIMTTYDSFGKVKTCIKPEDLCNWNVVVDEFQCLVNDSTFRSEVVNDFMNNLDESEYKNLTFISATPIPEDILHEIPYFAKMPITILEWEEMPEIRINRWNPKDVTMRDCICGIIRLYKIGLVPIGKDENGKVYKSNEAVFFINSVKGIADIITKTQLKPEDVNIIVADTDLNKGTLKENLPEGFSVGKPQAKGEKHKKFTFCTSTAYFGVDMYSDSATTFIVSDSNTTYTTVDVMTEIPQIIGRQRNEKNIFRNNVYVIYNNSIGADGLATQIERKKNRSDFLLEHFYDKVHELDKDSYAEDLKQEQDANKYCYSYNMFDKSKNSFAINNWKYLADKMRVEALKKYKLDSSFDTSLENQGFTLNNEIQITFNGYFERLNDIEIPTCKKKRFKKFYELKKSNSEDNKYFACFYADDLDTWNNYINAFIDEDYAYFDSINWSMNLIEKKYQLRIVYKKLYPIVKDVFKVGSFWRNGTEIKKKLKEIIESECPECKKITPTTEMLKEYGLYAKSGQRGVYNGKNCKNLYKIEALDNNAESEESEKESA